MVAWTEAEKTVLPWALIFIVIVSIVVCVLTAKKRQQNKANTLNDYFSNHFRARNHKTKY